MKLRLKDTQEICSSDKFNIHAISEIIVYFDNDMGTDFIKNYDVWLETKEEWKDLSQSFKDKDVIPDNYNSYFREPKNEIEREQGWYEN